MTSREVVAFMLGMVLAILGADVAFMRQTTACAAKVGDAFYRGLQTK